MDNLDFTEIPDDDHEAFLFLERALRAEFEGEIEVDNSNYSYYAIEYLNKTLAAAETLGIDEILNSYSFSTSGLSKKSSSEINEAFQQIRRASDKLRISNGINSGRAARAFSVGFKPEQKEKIHAYLDKIRKEVEKSDASLDKKEKLFSIIASLASEVDKARTRFDRFADLARALAGVSKDVAEEGAEPWWKWVKAIFGIIDTSKNEERQLPKPAELKRITKHED